MSSKPESAHEKRIYRLRKAAEIIPFGVVSCVFFLNLITGILNGTELLTIMIRSIIAVILFALLGYFLGKNLKSIADTMEKAGDVDTKKNVIDIAADTDDAELLREMRENSEEFQEANPAKFSAKGL